VDKVAMTQNIIGKASAQRDSRGEEMKPQDQYLKFVRWEDLDQLYVGYCPDLFPWGGVCHGATEQETFVELCLLVAKEVEELKRSGKGLPQASTRPMRDAMPA
jgi:hypothetical protein